MTEFLLMLRVSIDVIALMIRSPHVLGALTAILSCAVLAWRTNAQREPAARRGSWELALLFLLPLAMLAWGIAWRPESGAAASPHQVMLLKVLAAIGATQLLLAMSFMWRHRQRLVLTTVLAMMSSLWAAGAYFTARMNITNVWL